MDADGIRRALVRIAHEILEKNRGVEHVVLVGIRTKGVPLARRIAAEIKKIENKEIPVGSLDITLYRDDLTTMGYNPVIRGTEIDFDLTGKHIVLVDDVLYTGRTIRAALDALTDARLARMPDPSADSLPPEALDGVIAADRPGSQGTAHSRRLRR